MSGNSNFSSPGVSTVLLSAAKPKYHSNPYSRTQPINRPSDTLSVLDSDECIQYLKVCFVVEGGDRLLTVGIGIVFV